ncbi:uncharacterized protein ACA1_056890 [Acanthamoeba castellanii str. Neff]|uniref:Uncharacterized protein n=1 Tax=Acanthamoeba castellanii (strain ATCC 30010 / Neff) TaxID=1257118 RepID=L8GWW3_ACACF|nr:uncharacterized protein ACA1_056890 [Acanthamoeba castellanii str. Neff]ELR17058.1 hypothetical protein ACA1_056890 [Acanthamoeba castellanii str. Neff]
MMGAMQSNNEINTAINSMIAEINSTTQHCQTKSSQGQQINVDTVCGPNVSKIDISHNNFNIQGTFDSSHNSNAADQNIKNMMKQLAKSLEGSLGIGYVSANNVQQLTEDIAATINNSTINDCIVDLAMNQGIYVKLDSGKCPMDSDIKITYNNFNELSTDMTSCMQMVANSNTAMQTLRNIIDQKATATVEGILSPLLIIILVILLIVGGIMFGGTKMLTSLAFIALLLVLLIVYGVIAWLKKWFPFNG